MDKYKVSHPGVYYLSIASLTIVLVLCGLFFGAVLFSDHYTKQLKEDIRLVAELNDPAVDEKRDRLISEFKEIKGVRPGSVRYVTAEEALEEAIDELGGLALSEEMSNPFYDMVEFSLEAEYVYTDSLEKLSSHLVEELPVRDVIYPASELDDIFAVFKYARARILVIMALALVMSGLLIHHIMRLSVVSQAKQIRTMELVGATPAFVRRPFLRLGVKMGLLGWVWALVVTVVLSLLVFGLSFTTNWMLSIAALTGGIVLLGLSIGLCFLSTLLAVNQSLGKTISR